MVYVLGIDGGGTKTTGVIANEDGQMIVEATVGASNPNIVDHNQLVHVFSSLVNKLQEKNTSAFQQVGRVFAGISGAAHPHAKQKLTDILKQVMPSIDSITVDNDAVIALYSGTMGKPGIVQISGTGSITYGINSDNVRDRVGGWGHFVGERGSGYGLGHDALKAVFSVYDQMGKPTKLTQLILHHFQVTDLSQIIPFIYQANNPKETIASLGRLVMEAADDGDEVATEIMKQNGSHIGECIKTLIIKLFSSEQPNTDKTEMRTTQQKDETIPIVLAGGLFNRLDLFQQAIEREVNKQPHQVKLIKPENPPVYGAIRAALRGV